MKRRALVFLLVLSLLVSASGIAAMAADESTVASIGDTAYTSLQAAVDAVYNKQVDDNSTIVLEKDTTEQITVNCDVYVNLNGNDIAGVTVTAGTFYGVDTQTVDFTVEDGNGYGTIGTYTGDVQAAFSPEEDGYGYLMFSYNGANASFHYVELRITDMTLHPQNEEGKYNPSVSYKSTCAGDEVVAANVDSFGVALSVAGVPGEIEKEKCGFSEFDDFVAGKEGNAGKSTMLKGIMKESYAYLINKRNATMKVYGQAYIKVNGENIYGKCEARDLKDQVEGANRIWTRLNSTQKAGLQGLSDRHSKIMGSWDLSALTAPYNNVVEDAVTWYEEFMNLPTVSADMTVNELRQLAVDTFRLQLSYKWTPDTKFLYMDHEGDYTTIEPGVVYKGTPYCMSHTHFDTNDDGFVDAVEQATEYSIGSSNLFKVLKYYDPNAGLLKISEMGTDVEISNILINNCSGGLSWALGRVSNNHSLFTSSHYTPANGALPVGRIILNEAEITFVGDRDEIYYNEDAIKNLTTFTSGVNPFGQKKGDFYKSYAELQPGDILLTAGHVRMCSGVVAPRDENGSLIYDECYVWYIDQNSYGSSDENYDNAEFKKEYSYEQSNGYMVHDLGGMRDHLKTDPNEPVGTKISFQELLKAHYIPLTIPEFCTEEELIAYKNKAAGYFAEAGKTELWETSYAPKYDALIANRGIEAPVVTTTSSLYTQTKLTPTKFYALKGSFSANYVISDFRVVIEDQNGNVLAEEYPHISTGDRSRNVKVDDVRNATTLLSMNKLTEYAGKGNWVKIETHLSTGQWYTAVNFEIG